MIFVLRILSYEGRFPNRLEQHITDIKNYLINELQLQNILLPNQIQSPQHLNNFNQNI